MCRRREVHRDRIVIRAEREQRAPDRIANGFSDTRAQRDSLR
jgi:hypothetical protein